MTTTDTTDLRPVIIRTKTRAWPFGPTRHQLHAAVKDSADQVGSARLCLDMGMPAEAADALAYALRRLRDLEADLRAGRRLGLILTAVLASVAMLAAGIVLARPAAAVVTASPIVRVAVASQTVTFTTTVSTSSTIDRVHGASIWVGYPGDATMTLVGTGTSRTAQVPVRVRLDARRITTWGVLDAVAVDDADGTSRPVVLDVRRRSQARLTHAEARPDGRVVLGARITHYSPAAGGWVASRLSPVVFQELTATGWVSRGRATTTIDGLAGATLDAGPGTHIYRAVRPVGASVWAATSTRIRVAVSPPAHC